MGELAHQAGLGAAGAVDLVLVHEVDLVVAGHAHDLGLPGGVEVADIVAEHAKGVLGLGVHHDDLGAQLRCLAGAGGTGVAGAADHDLGVDGLGDLVGRDLGFLAQPTGAQHLAHGLAGVALEGHTDGGSGGLGGGANLSGLGGGAVARRRLVSQGDARHGAGSGGHTRAGHKATAGHAGHGCGQGDAAADLREFLDQTCMGVHGHPSFFPLMEQRTEHTRRILAAMALGVQPARQTCGARPYTGCMAPP